MPYFFLKIKKHLRSLLQFALVFGVALLVLLYLTGRIDFSFLDRYDIFGEDGGPTSNPFAPITLPKDEVTETEPDRPSGDVIVSDDSFISDTGDDEDAVINTAKVFDGASLPDRLRLIKTTSRALRDGYVIAPTDGSYSYDADRSTLAKLTFDFKLPKKYANGVREVWQEVVVYPNADELNDEDMPSDAPYVVYETARETRPAVELYMGYILLDDGKDFYLLNSDGVPLCRYDATRYMPAYARDKDDRPLFFRVEEDGTVHYFHLSADGTRFELSAFDPATDDRGLHFDYPTNWGKTDATSLMIVSDEVPVIKEEEEAVEASADGTDAVVETEAAAAEGVDPEAVDAAAEPVLELRYAYAYRGWDGNASGYMTSLRYTMARPFRENRAAVTTDEDRGSLYFINENGYRVFPNVVTYINEHNRYVTSYLLPPLTTGLESIGSYYYDQGVVRVRRQILDYWNYEVKERERVVKEEDILLRLDGAEVFIPAGYELEGYSEGMAILSKNGFYGVYDVTGQWIAQPIYRAASPFLSGISVLQLPDGRCGAIDRSGDIVLPFTYDHITTPSSGLIATYRAENGWVVYQIMDNPSYVEEDEGTR